MSTSLPLPQSVSEEWQQSRVYERNGIGHSWARPLIWIKSRVEPERKSGTLALELHRHDAQ